MMFHSDILLYFREAPRSDHNGQADPETARPCRHHQGDRHAQAAHLLEIRQGEELSGFVINLYQTYFQVELAPPSPAEIPVAIADLSTKIANAQKQSFRSWTVGVKLSMSLILLLSRIRIVFNTRQEFSRHFTTMLDISSQMTNVVLTPSRLTRPC